MTVNCANAKSRRRAKAARGVVSVIFLACAAAIASDNPAPDRPIATVHAEAVRKVPDKDYPEHFQVFVRLEVHALDKPLVIPYCDGDKSEGYRPCSARLQRTYRKRWIYAKPLLDAVLGTEKIETWKALKIAPGDRALFNFGFSERLFGIQKGEDLRVAMDTWADGNSWSNGIPDHVVMSTPFRFSTN